MKIKAFLFCFHLTMVMKDLQYSHQILVYWGKGGKARKFSILGQIIKQRSKRQKLDEEFMREVFQGQWRILPFAYLEFMLLPSLSQKYKNKKYINPV